VIAVGTMDHSELVGGPATVTMRLLTIDPGEVLGWHSHPGAGAFTVVTSGVLNVEDGCGGESVYTAGQAFLEPPGRVHRGKNLTDEPCAAEQVPVHHRGPGLHA
jgi:quercetin dioxygenase-like cupin family protein